MDDFYLSSVLEYILSPKGGQRSATIVYTRAFLLFLLDLLLGRFASAKRPIVFARFIIRAPPRSGRRPIVIVFIIIFILSIKVLAEMGNRRDMVPTPIDRKCALDVRKRKKFRKFEIVRKL